MAFQSLIFVFVTVVTALHDVALRWEVYNNPDCQETISAEKDGLYDYNLEDGSREQLNTAEVCWGVLGS